MKNQEKKKVFFKISKIRRYYLQPIESKVFYPYFVVLDIKKIASLLKNFVYLNYTRHGSYGSSDTIQNELQQELLYISRPYFIHG